MASHKQLRPEPASIPDAPGVYRFRDEGGRVIYVGKAKSLRSRLASYFQDYAGLHPRTQTMVSTATDVDWTVVGTEVEALQLEYSWIKQYSPRFNVRYRDDKSYPYLAVTMDEEYPRVQVMRGAKRRGVRYFGPYPQVWAIRETVDLLLRAFPVRTCSAGVFRRARTSGRPCLLGYIGKCSAPCVGRVTPEEHRALANDFCSFLAGDTGRFLRQLESEMRAAALEEDFERAARLRDDVAALRTAMEKQSVVLSEATDADVIALSAEPLEAAVQVFYVRGGRIRGQRGWVLDRVDDADVPELVERFLQQLYGGVNGEGAVTVPREVLVSALPEDADALREWMSGIRGSKVDLRVPQRGSKLSLMETVTKNARETLARHKTKRASDLTTRSHALNEIADALGMEQAPLRVECFDVSNLQGSHVVASMVVFEDGLARKSEYRRFSIRGVDGQNDVAAIAEVITRRFKRYLEESRTSGELVGAESVEEAGQAAAKAQRAAEGEVSEAPVKFAYPPNLVVVDGGKPQVEAAWQALEALGIDDVAVCGLAKRLEEVWLPGEEDPLILPRSSEGLYLLQRLRDEAHRFAISYHRSKRSAAVGGSALDQVAGVGPARRAALLKHFGSLRRMSRATVEEIAAVPGVGEATARAIQRALHEDSAQAGDRGDTNGH